MSQPATTTVPEIIDLAVDAHLTGATGLASAVADIAPGESRLILLDVSMVTSVTASGLADVVQALRAARARGSDLRIWGRSGQFTDAHRHRGLDRVFRVFPDRASAAWRDAGLDPQPAHVHPAGVYPARVYPSSANRSADSAVRRGRHAAGDIRQGWQIAA